MREKPLVLLVDDEEVFLEIAAMQLRAQFEISEAHNVEEAFRLAESLIPDFILSDVYMPPGPNGWEFALELRQSSKTRDIPFAFFTSLHDPWMELKHNKAEVAEKLGRVTFFSKTDDVDVLAERLKSLIKK